VLIWLYKQKDIVLSTKLKKRKKKLEEKKNKRYIGGRRVRKEDLEEYNKVRGRLNQINSRVEKSRLKYKKNEEEELLKGLILSGKERIRLVKEEKFKLKEPYVQKTEGHILERLESRLESLGERI
jgi:hypothetical protein